jgi:hypothetical protein
MGLERETRLELATLCPERSPRCVALIYATDASVTA